MEKDYEEMTKEELIQSCRQKDIAISECMSQMQKSSCKLYSKSDIMNLYQCESNKALRILKLIFQMGYGNKIGKEYYVPQDKHTEFMRNFAGKEVFI